MKRQVLKFNNLIENNEAICKDELISLKGGKATEDPVIGGDLATNGEVTISAAGNVTNNFTNWYLGFFGGMNWETGYSSSGAGNENGGNGGGSNSFGITNTVSQTVASNTILSNAFFNLTQSFQQGVLSGNGNGNVTVNHNVIDGHYDGIDIQKGAGVISIGIKGNISLGIAIGNSTFSVSQSGINSFTFTQSSNSNGAISTIVTDFNINSVNTISAALVAYGSQDLIPIIESAFETIEEVSYTVGLPL
jgi:hypothetical protein